METALKFIASGARRHCTAIVLGLLTLPVLAAAPPSQIEPELRPLAKHERIGELVSEFVEKSHYQHDSVNDELSSEVLDRYIESLDSKRLYFLASDIEAFEKYRHELDDMVRSESLMPVFDMFEVYRTRARERLNYALKTLETKPDFTVGEEYVFDRDDLPWAETEAELDELWRKRVKNDALSLILAEKTWEEAREMLHDRYSRFLKRMDQIKSEDVFETFMNAFAHTLDPHSSYLSPRSSEEYRIAMSLSYFGIGASLQIEEDYVKVVKDRKSVV